MFIIFLLFHQLSMIMSNKLSQLSQLFQQLKHEMYCYFVDKRPQNFQYHGNEVTWKKRNLFTGNGSQLVCGGIALQLYLIQTKDWIWSNSKYNGLSPQQALKHYPLNLEHDFSSTKCY